MLKGAVKERVIKAAKNAKVNYHNNAQFNKSEIHIYLLGNVTIKKCVRDEQNWMRCFA